METFVDVFLKADGDKASTIFKRLTEMGLKYYIGDHDFVHDWKGIVTIEDELDFIDRIQDKLKGSGAFLKFKTIR